MTGGLTAKQKLFWIYILDECNHAGIWEKNYRLASFQIGEEITEEECLQFLGKRVIPIGDSKLFIPNFIVYQYNALKEDAIPNGGHRNIIVAKKMKAEGVKRGVPDIFVPIPRGLSNGLFIEMKVGKNGLTQEQKDFFQTLILNNYSCVICYTWEEAVHELENYLNLKLNLKLM